jgi:hypothetical protein
VLKYLEALTFDFQRDRESVSAVLIYSEPDPDEADMYRFVVAADSGYEGIACLDDTARAANLALAVYERNGSRKALALARRWLTFVTYMQYPDGDFANFIRNAAGVRNATGQTSVKGGYWWSVRALWALARAYRLTGDKSYLAHYQLCRLDPPADGKIRAVMALGELELFRVEPSEELKSSILEHCNFVASTAVSGYFKDQPSNEIVSMWGYHQLHAVAEAARVLAAPHLLATCRSTVRTLIAPDVGALLWHSYPSKQKTSVCAYDAAPIVQGLAAMYRATDAKKYRDLALHASAWFYGRNDARIAMYDPSTGRCRDGISDGIASRNCGAESSIEAGFAELERRYLLEAS